MFVFEMGVPVIFPLCAGTQPQETFGLLRKPKIGKKMPESLLQNAGL